MNLGKAIEIMDIASKQAWGPTRHNAWNKIKSHVLRNIEAQKTASVKNFAKLAKFGIAVLDEIVNEEMWGDETVEQFLELGHRIGVVEEVQYDPKKHGNNIPYADPGDKIWWITRGETEGCVEVTAHGL